MDEFAKFYFCLGSGHPAEQALNVPAHLSPLFGVMANLIDLPNDGRLFSETKPVVCCLIKAWEDELGMRFNWEDINSLYDNVSVSSDPPSIWGVREKNPVFTLLMHPMLLYGELQISPQYTALIPFLFRRVRQCYNQVEGATDSYLYSLSMAARKLVIGAPRLQLSPKFNWQYEFKLFLATSAMQEKINNTVEITSAPEWTYISDLLFRDRKKLRKGGGGHSGKRQSRWLLYERGCGPALINNGDLGCDFQELESDSDCFSPDNKGKLERESFLHPDADKKLLESGGEDDVDYVHDHELTLPASWFSDPWTAKRKMRGKQEAMLASERILPWDLKCLSMMTIRSVLAQCLVRQAEPWRAILGMGLLTGSGEKGMKKIRTGMLTKDGDPCGELTEKLLQRGRFYIPEKRQLWWLNFRGAENVDGYLNVPLIVRLDLPRTITRHLPADGEQQGLVFTKNDFTKAKTFLKRLGEDGLSVPSLRRLQITFEALFVHGAGMPELLADHLQERRRNHLTSQHFYVSIPWSYAVCEWSRMVGAFLRTPKTSISELLKKMKFRAVSEVVDGLEFIGAAKTPDPKALKRHSKLLLSTIPNSQGKLLIASAAQWNAYVSYLYLLLASCTGRRPQRDPFPLFSDFDLVAGNLYIDDKWNRKFKESRVVPLCPTLLQAMKNHLQIHNKQFMRWKREGYSSDVPVNQIFLVDESSKALVEVTPSNLDRLTHLTTEQGCFEGLGNGCRHFLLTRLHNVGIPQEAIDLISGHRHVAREPEMSTSLLSWSISAQWLSDTIEREIVQYLGLKVPFTNA